MALTSIVVLVGRLFNLQKEYKKQGKKRATCGPTAGTELFMFQHFEPMIRKEEGGDDRKFQFIKLLSIRMSSYLRPSYLLFNHPHIFFTIAYRSHSLSLSRTRAFRPPCVRIRTYSLSPVCFIVFPPCCTYKARTLLRSHGDAVMLVERMRNALVYVALTHAFARICVRVRVYRRIYMHAFYKG